MSRFSWIYEIKEFEKHLTAALKDYEDLSLLNDILKKQTGVEAIIEVMENFLKSSIRIPERPMLEMKKVYVYQNSKNPVKAMARKLDVDESTIARWLREFGMGKTSYVRHKKKINKKDILSEILD